MEAGRASQTLIVNEILDRIAKDRAVANALAEVVVDNAKSSDALKEHLLRWARRQTITYFGVVGSIFLILLSWLYVFGGYGHLRNQAAEWVDARVRLEVTKSVREAENLIREATDRIRDVNIELNRVYAAQGAQQIANMGILYGETRVTIAQQAAEVEQNAGNVRRLSDRVAAMMGEVSEMTTRAREQRLEVDRIIQPLLDSGRGEAIALALINDFDKIREFTGELRLEFSSPETAQRYIRAVFHLPTIPQIGPRDIFRLRFFERAAPADASFIALRYNNRNIRRINDTTFAHDLEMNPFFVPMIRQGRVGIVDRFRLAQVQFMFGAFAEVENSYQEVFYDGKSVRDEIVSDIQQYQRGIVPGLQTVSFDIFVNGYNVLTQCSEEPAFDLFPNPNFIASSYGQLLMSIAQFPAGAVERYLNQVRALHRERVQPDAIQGR